MGKTAYRVSEEDALSYVFGYCTGNDFSARDLQRKTSQFLLGKTSDGFAPIGPYLVTADQIPDPNKLKLECFVNGERRRRARASLETTSPGVRVLSGIARAGSRLPPWLLTPQRGRSWPQAGSGGVRQEQPVSRWGWLSGS